MYFGVDTLVPNINAALKLLQRRARRRLLTGRGGSRPGSAEAAADNPQQEHCPAAGARSRQHPSPPGRRRSKSSLRRCSLSLRRVLEGRWAVLKYARKPSPSRFLFSPHPPPGSSSSGFGAAGVSQPSFSLRAGIASCTVCQCNAGGGNSNQEGKGGGRGEGTDTYPALSSEKKKKITTGRGRGVIRRAEAAEEEGRATGTVVLLLPLRESAPSAAGQRDSGAFQSPVSSHGELVYVGSAQRSRGARTASALRGAGKHLPSGGARAAATAAESRRRRRRQRLRARAASEAEGSPPFSSLFGPLLGSSSASASSSSSSSLPYPSGCQNPSALPWPRLKAKGRLSRPAGAHQLGRGRRKEARASPLAGGDAVRGAEVGDLPCNPRTLLQTWLLPTRLQEGEHPLSDAFSFPSLLPFR